jgi:hypothetical protein
MIVLSHSFGDGEKHTPSASEIAGHIRQLLPHVHSGTLRFWGVWFGRPHDNVHTIVHADAAADCLTLRFNGEETLQVWNPTGCQIDSQQFIILSASRVLWQWYWYGRPHTPDSLMSEEFVRDGTSITFRSTFPGRHTQRPSIHEPAVQIH